MCRWITHSGTPVLLSQVLFQPEHSLIDQGLHFRMGVQTTNGDGFGIGCYPQDTEIADPAVLRDVGTAWNDRNPQEAARHTCSGLFFGRIRASTRTAVRQSNCHFWSGRWPWVHNGMISEFRRIRRDLALTLGLTDDPPGAVPRMAGLVETTAETHGVPHPLQMTVAVTDGERVWAVRYSSEGRSRSLYVSTKVGALRALHPDVSFLPELSDETRLVVSEPLGDLPGAWNEVSESSYGVFRPGGGVLHRFRPGYAGGPWR